MLINSIFKVVFFKNIFWLYQVISNKSKIRLIKLIILMFICAISEVISISAVIPFLALLINPENSQNFYIFNNFFNSFKNYEPLFISGFILILTNILTPVLRLYNLKKSGLITSEIGTELSYLLYKININQPYGEYIKFNSSNLISAASIDIGRVVQIMSSINNMLTGIFISLFIIFNLLIVNSKIALSSLIIFGSCYLFIGSFTKSRLVRNSKIVSENNVKLVNLIQDIFGSIREVILYQYQDVSLKEYINVDKPMRKYSAENIFIASFPKYILESAGLIFITLIAILLSSGSSDTSSIFPLLGVFAISAQRLLPSLQQIYVGWSTAKGYQASLLKIKTLIQKKTIQYEKNQINQKLIFSKKISFRNTSYRYSIEKDFILSDINFEIFKGEKIGLIGCTGAGKSTLINMAMGFLPPTKGQISIDDKLISSLSEINNLREWQKLIAYVPQNIYLKDGSFIDNIAFGVKKEKVNLGKVMQAAANAQIIDYIESTENGFNTKVGERGILLSGGQAQRIAIARALYRESRILILDESTSALDVSTENKIIKSIFRKKELTLIMITHRLSTLKFCDRILLIKSGNVETISYKKAIEIMNKI